MTPYKKKLRRFCLRMAGVLFLALAVYFCANILADFIRPRLTSFYVLSADGEGKAYVCENKGITDYAGDLADLLLGGSFTDAGSAFRAVSAGFGYDEEGVSYIEDMPLASPKKAGLVIEKTVSSGGGKDTASDKITVNNETSYRLPEELTEPAFALKEGGAQVLIVHSHSTECYTPAGTYDFTLTGEDRTTDTDYNMVRIGAELKTQLEKRGIEAVHITELFDYPEYDNSYARSCSAVEKVLEDNPQIKIVLDLHRDSIINSEGVKTKLTTEIDGEKVAQVMLVVGTDELGLKHDNWRTNLQFAMDFQKFLLEQEENFARPINLRTSRFNGHTAPGAVIVEVGTGANTPEEALASVKYIANAVKNLINFYN